MFAVLDTETTGLFPGGHDRLIEIAIVALDEFGAITSEFVTLINPDRDLGPTHIHRIEARDVLDAPHFADIAGDIVERLAGRIVVGHNLRFDLDFLRSEFDRLGHRIPHVPRICTLHLARQALRELDHHRLADCCQYLDIERTAVHSALADARAAASLFARLVTLNTGWVDSIGDFRPQGIEVGAWPALTPSQRVCTRSQALQNRNEPGYLARLIERLGAVGTGENTTGAEYADLLSRAIEDRRVTESEAEALGQVAARWGLSVTQARAIHEAYLEGLVAAALADGRVTEIERRDLDDVARLLGFEPTRVDRLIATAPRRKPDSGQAKHSASGNGDLRGRSVCFTGEFQSVLNGERISRGKAEELVLAAGLNVFKGVTKKLDLLVVADPDSLSTKARKARGYGTRIVSELAFWRMLGVNVE